MTKLTIYLPDEIADKARNAAKAKGRSVSRWIVDQVVQSDGDTWSKAVLDAAGAFRDFPSLEEIRSGYGKRVSREPSR